MRTEDGLGHALDPRHGRRPIRLTFRDLWPTCPSATIRTRSCSRERARARLRRGYAAHAKARPQGRNAHAARGRGVHATTGEPAASRRMTRPRATAYESPPRSCLMARPSTPRTREATGGRLAADMSTAPAMRSGSRRMRGRRPISTHGFPASVNLSYVRNYAPVSARAGTSKSWCDRPY